MLDKNNSFDENVEHLQTEASANVIDLGVKRNLGAGQGIIIGVKVLTAMTDSGGDSTMTVTLETDDNSSFSSPTEIQTVGTFAAASAQGSTLQVPFVITDNCDRYIRLKYTVANGDLTTGKFSSYLSLVPVVDTKYTDGKSAPLPLV